MQTQIQTPDFKDWPPHSCLQGKTLHNIIKVYLRQKIDAEWRAVVLKDTSYQDWLLPEYSLDGLIDYLVLVSHVDRGQIDKWEWSIRERYTWE